MFGALAFLLTFFAAGGSLGVQVYDLPPDIRAQSAIYNLQGVVVGQIVPGGAASRSSLRVNDIITEVAAEPVTDVPSLLSILSHHSAGETVQVGIVRPGNKLPWPTIALRVKLGAASSGPDTRPANVVSPTTPVKRIVQPGGLRTVDASGALAVSPRQRGVCRTLAPGGWDIVGARDQGDAIDVMSGDHNSYAGWSIRGVNPQMRPYYGDMYADPSTSSRYVVGMVGQTLGSRGQFSFVGQPTQIGAGFVAQELASASHRAMIVYRLYPSPPFSPQGSYIISLRIAIAPRSGGDRALNTAVGVAAATQCTTQFIAPKNGDISLPRPGDAFDRKRKSETGDLTDYNVQLGSQYAHSPSTGQNYLLDRASQYDSNGPDGPGYYRKVGNSYEKLVPGIQ
jgi:hypothetical protein